MSQVLVEIQEVFGDYLRLEPIARGLHNGEPVEIYRVLGNHSPVVKVRRRSFMLPMKSIIAAVVQYVRKQADPR